MKFSGVGCQVLAPPLATEAASLIEVELHDSGIEFHEVSYKNLAPLMPDTRHLQFLTTCCQIKPDKGLRYQKEEYEA